jgi:carbonic anhydrase
MESMKVFIWSALLLASVSVQASLCENGKRQSPINITATQKRSGPEPDFAYHPAPLNIANDGHTVRVRFDKRSTLRLGKEQYTLQQFHFHTPGGDQIHGEEFPMAAHLLHKSASGQLLAVVVLFRTGKENSVLRQLLPLIPPKQDGDHLQAGLSIDAVSLVPRQHAYYRYTGSLTAAPCTEGVEWIVMKQPLELSGEQLAAYRNRFADNGRAVQPLHQRTVVEVP